MREDNKAEARMGEDTAGVGDDIARVNDTTAEWEDSLLATARGGTFAVKAIDVQTALVAAVGLPKTH